MILTCPACSARFMVADATFGAKPRRVRCGKCRHEWRAEPSAESIAAAPPPPPVELQPIPAGSNVPAVARDTKAILRSAGLGLLGFAAVALGGWLLMTAVLGSFTFKSGALPPTLALSDIATRYQENSSGGYALVVEGKIKNSGSTNAVVPPVAVAIKNATGAVVNKGTASVQRAELLGNDTTSFVYTLEPVPDNIADVTVEFASPDDKADGNDAAQP